MPAVTSSHVDSTRTRMHDGRFTATFPFQVDTFLARFTLNMLGGNDAISTMAGVHIYSHRRWLGWYSTLGSFQLARRLSSFAKSASIHGVLSRKLSSNSFSSIVCLDPATLFEPNKSYCKGPRFRAVHSDTVIEDTGYLAALLVRECAAWNSDRRVVPGRKMQPVEITIAGLGRAPASEMQPARASVLTLLAAGVTIAVSAGTCVLCAVFQDWWAFSSIFASIVANGVFCLVLGSADLVFTYPVPPRGSPPGDGILGSERDIVLLKGTEGAVSSITRGHFSLHLSSLAHYNLIQLCSLLFSVLCITHLLLIPQASLFGQVLFLTSHTASALYNTWLFPLDKGRVHQRLLFGRIPANPTLTKYILGTHSAAVVFILLILQPRDPKKLLDELLPDDTRVWKQWKSLVLEQLCRPGDHLFLSEGKLEYARQLTQRERELFELLYEDARAAYSGFKDYLGVELL